MKLLNAKNKITFDFHPKAAVNFNNKADAFVKRLCVISNAEDQKTELFKDTPTSLILKEDGIQFLNRSTIDSKSNETSTHFFEDPNWLGFAEQDYAYFRSFCLDVSQVGPLKCKTSIEFILKMSLSWIQKKHNDSNYNIQYTEYIKKCCEEEVFSRTVIFPIDGLYVQASYYPRSGLRHPAGGPSARATPGRGRGPGGFAARRGRATGLPLQPQRCARQDPVLPG